MEKLTVKDLAMFIGCKCWFGKREGFAGIGDIISPKVLGYVEQGFNCKPILRPLSDMTEEEAIEIAKIIYGQPDSVKWKVESNKYKKALLVYRRHYQKRFVICLESGEIECYDMDGVDESKDIYMNQHFVTKYLILKQFDVFGWIEKGLAIEKTKREFDS